MILRAFHNDPGIKNTVLERIDRARAKREMWRGSVRPYQVGYEGERRGGCAVGVEIESGDWYDFQLELGLPIYLADAEWYLFETLHEDYCYDFPTRLMEAIPVGADLTTFRWEMAKRRYQAESLNEIDVEGTQFDVSLRIGEHSYDTNCDCGGTHWWRHMLAVALAEDSPAWYRFKYLTNVISPHSDGEGHECELCRVQISEMLIETVRTMPVPNTPYIKPRALWKPRSVPAPQTVLNLQDRRNLRRA